MTRAPLNFVYKAVADCAIQADVYPAAGLALRPVLVYIHGGCLMYGSRRHIDPRQAAAYVAAGLTVVAIDYRLAPETRLRFIVEDLWDAFAWVRQRGPALFGVDAGRVAVVGHSAGGYLALLAGCTVTPRPRAVVSFYGYGDIVAPWYSQPDPYYCTQPTVSRDDAFRLVQGPPISEATGERANSPIYLYCRQQGLWPQVVGGVDPRQDPAYFEHYCPARRVAADFPPTLLLHGDRDTDVPHAQSVQMAEALAARGVEHELITLAGREHGFDDAPDAPDVARALSRVVAFLRRHLA